MASNDSSGERRTQPYRFEQIFDDGEVVRPIASEGGHPGGSLERQGSSSQPEQRLSQTSHEWDIVIGVSVIAASLTQR